MAHTFKLQVVTPEKQAVTEQVSSVTLPGVEGSFGVLAGHMPFLSALKAGPLRIVREGKTKTYQIGGGFAEVRSDSVIVLAESIESFEEDSFR